MRGVARLWRFPCPGNPLARCYGTCAILPRSGAFTRRLGRAAASHVGVSEAFFAEGRVSLVLAPHEPYAERPADRPPAELEPFGLGRFDHFVICHRLSVARGCDASPRFPAPA